MTWGNIPRNTEHTCSTLKTDISTPVFFFGSSADLLSAKQKSRTLFLLVDCVVWLQKPGSFVGGYRNVGGTRCQHLHFYSKYEGSIFLRNVDNYLPDYTVS
jgi:hypothetical protein